MIKNVKNQLGEELTNKDIDRIISQSETKVCVCSRHHSHELCNPECPCQPETNGSKPMQKNTNLGKVMDNETNVSEWEKRLRRT